MKTPQFIKKAWAFLKTSLAKISTSKANTARGTAPTPATSTTALQSWRVTAKEVLVAIKNSGKAIAIAIAVILIVIAVLVGIGWLITLLVPRMGQYLIQLSFTAFAFMVALLVWSKKGWLQGLLTFVISVALIMLVPIGIRVVNSSMLPYVGGALGALLLIAGIYFVATRISIRQIKLGGNKDSAKKLFKALVIAGLCLGLVCGLLNWIGVAFERDVWVDIVQTKWWLFGGCVGAGIIIAYFDGHGWVRFSALALLFVVFMMAMSEVEVKSQKDADRINAARVEVIRQQAATVPVTRKIWTLGIQKHTREVRPLKGFRYYEVAVKRLDDESIEICMRNGNEVTHFRWLKRHSARGSWIQENPTKAGTFWLKPVPGVDRYEGELLTSENKKLALTLEGKM